MRLQSILLAALLFTGCATANQPQTTAGTRRHTADIDLSGNPPESAPGMKAAF
ncbi:MAG: hypothetical protein ACJ8HQ_11230 [Chthoniobacterales bacterium]